MVDNDVKNIFAKNVLKLRKNKNITQKELGEQLGLGKTTISQWESAQKLPNAGSIEKIATFFNVPKSTLFEEEGSFSTIGRLVNLPIVGSISNENDVISFENISNYEPTSEDWIDGDCFYVRASEKTTNKRIHNGDLLLIRKQDHVLDGEIALVLINKEVMLKTIYTRGDSLILQSEDSSAPVVVDKNDKNIKMIGRLKKAIINF